MIKNNLTNIFSKIKDIFSNSEDKKYVALVNNALTRQSVSSMDLYDRILISYDIRKEYYDLFRSLTDKSVTYIGEADNFISENISADAYLISFTAKHKDLKNSSLVLNYDLDKVSLLLKYFPINTTAHGVGELDVALIYTQVVAGSKTYELKTVIEPKEYLNSGPVSNSALDAHLGDIVRKVFISNQIPKITHSELKKIPSNILDNYVF